MIDSEIELNKVIVVPLISKDSLDINDAKNYYGTELHPNQPIPTIVSTQSEVNSLVNQKSGNNQQLANEERLVILLKQQEVEKDKTFDTNKYFNELSTDLFGKNLIHTEVISSTQDIMLKYLTYTRQGLVMIADQQTDGRGRDGNKFLSPLGCLLMSFKCKQTDCNKLPFLQYLTGMAMVEAIHSFPIASDLNLSLKWPNEIFTKEAGIKLGGVLCEPKYLNNEFDVVIGVGVYLSNSNNPSTTVNQLIHQKQQHGSSLSSTTTSTDIPIYINREELVSKFFNKFEPMFMEFTRDGFNADLENRYTDLWMHTNQIVKVKERDYHHVKIIGISDRGFLKVIECDAGGNSSPNSQIVELNPESTSFDIQNLILMQKSQ
ncbi:biotin--[acetyl-CoA-carboxylase] ligase 2 [Dictyostelium discoideum AX4]|uniref:Biotin--[acetyl-CoA-carboxylase] ligase 2 n=1 Tax=Dictyostelium discoideum TaxID=44689 RepID=Q54IF6_DICDI|nr:biotin--[acetyl-CoA-carboxylase] ligase 2 [Dictyostelium discoideum AX4]EAL63016.1 biotin--[acetyl-CoA-carboxylase] ligase 2 [Dictyostelium discoideum AX4]|eukprot:XP_636521.1 biotin--[acetyl-CoA-carboxylase] ligase 2 [Dictyostelium discoideum AX4]